MTHYAKQEWMAYVEGRMPAGERRACEDHLYTCEACLLLYMECVPQVEEPVLQAVETEVEAGAWAEQVMGAIRRRKKAIPSKIALIRRPIFQYAVAAAITLILTTTGVFQSFSAQLSKIQTGANQAQASSYTDKLMDKTVTLLNSIPLQPEADLPKKGGVKHE